MSQSVNLYQISKVEFEKFSKNYESYDFEFNENNSTIFDQNFEGLNFLFSLYYKQLPTSLESLFYPKEFIGEEIDFDNIEDFPDSKTVYYLNSEVINEINAVLNKLENEKVLNIYNPEIFNTNDIYPSVWHNDEDEDQAFNKTHLNEGLNLLRKVFSEATKNGNYILYFSE